MRLLVLIWLLLSTSSGIAQERYLTKTGYIWFSSETPVEKIEAHNRTVNCALDIVTGDVAIRVLIRSFEFEKALMQEHFNENYMESHKYPTSAFQGKVIDISTLDMNKEGVYKFATEGNLTIHGVTRKVKEAATIEVKSGRIIIKSTFVVALADYDIRIPRVMLRNIAENITVNVEMTLEKLHK